MEWVRLTCCSCHVQFQVTRRHYERLQESGDSFWCPNGHKQHFTETEASRLRRELRYTRDMLDRKKDEVETTRRQLAAAKGWATRRKRQAARGGSP